MHVRNGIASVKFCK